MARAMNGVLASERTLVEPFLPLDGIVVKPNTIPRGGRKIQMVGECEMPEPDRFGKFFKSPSNLTKILGRTQNFLKSFSNG